MEMEFTACLANRYKLERWRH